MISFIGSGLHVQHSSQTKSHKADSGDKFRSKKVSHFCPLNTLINVLDDVSNDPVSITRSPLEFPRLSTEGPQESVHPHEERALSEGVIFHLLSEKLIQQPPNCPQEDDDKGMVS